MSDPTVVNVSAFHWGTPDQRKHIRFVLRDWNIPNLAYPIIVKWSRILPRGTIAYAGARGIVLAPGINGETLQRVFLHEYGHVWDKHHMDWSTRQHLLDTIGITDRNWYAPNHPWSRRPVEMFADAFRDTIIYQHTGITPWYGLDDRMPHHIITQLIRNP